MLCIVHKARAKSQSRCRQTGGNWSLGSGHQRDLRRPGRQRIDPGHGCVGYFLGDRPLDPRDVACAGKDIMCW